MERVALINYLNQLLNIKEFKDYCPNGLQVEGSAIVKKVVTGVTASQALLEAAVTKKADTIIVHHGYFWRGEDACIVGTKYRRLATLIRHNLNLFAYHLPLDAHSLYGNNVQLGKQLDFQVTEISDDGLFYVGKLKKAQNADELQQYIATRLQRVPQLVRGRTEKIKTIAWCTGGAQDFIEKAADYNVDAYLSGEISERTFHLAKELELDYFAAGHHATERYGIQALGEHLASKFNLDVEFIDIDNPV